MKVKLIVVVVILLCAFLSVYLTLGQQPSSISSKRGEEQASQTSIPRLTIPDIRFQAMNLDRKIEISSLRFDVALLNFWATWCAPCLVEMPSLIKMVNSSPSQGAGRMVLLAISTDENKEDIQKYLQKLKHQYPELDLNKNIYWIHDESKNISLQKFNVLRVPETIIINHRLEMIEKVVGERLWDEKEKQRILNKATGVGKGDQPSL